MAILWDGGDEFSERAAEFVSQSPSLRRSPSVLTGDKLAMETKPISDKWSILRWVIVAIVAILIVFLLARLLLGKKGYATVKRKFWRK